MTRGSVRERRQGVMPARGELHRRMLEEATVGCTEHYPPCWSASARVPVSERKRGEQRECFVKWFNDDKGVSAPSDNCGVR
jgi:hypothetical protein